MIARRAGLGAALLGVALACVSTAGDLPSVDSPPVEPWAAEIERAIHDRVNQERARQRLTPLAWQSHAAAVARAHSLAMALGDAPLEHDGYAAREAAVRRRVRLGRFGENLGAILQPGDSLPTLLVDAWMQSAAHRENVLGCFDAAGVGLARNGYGEFFVTQLYLLRGWADACSEGRWPAPGPP